METFKGSPVHPDGGVVSERFMRKVVLSRELGWHCGKDGACISFYSFGPVWHLQ